MAELFIELFSEEIPSRLQIDARKKIKQILEEKLSKKEITFNSSQSFSTPTRLVFLIEGIPEKIEQKGKVIRGPKIEAPESALAGFIKSNNLNKSDIYKKKTDKGEFYFSMSKSKTIDILKELQAIIPETLLTHTWKKSMKWSTHDLNWGRPLKSIAALFNGMKCLYFFGILTQYRCYRWVKFSIFNNVMPRTIDGLGFHIPKTINSNMPKGFH